MLASTMILVSISEVLQLPNSGYRSRSSGVLTAIACADGVLLWRKSYKMDLSSLSSTYHYWKLSPAVVVISMQCEDDWGILNRAQEPWPSFCAGISWRISPFSIYHRTHPITLTVTEHIPSHQHIPSSHSFWTYKLSPSPPEHLLIQTNTITILRYFTCYTTVTTIIIPSCNITGNHEKRRRWIITLVVSYGLF
jgi:hypothetical protein